jgi:PEP-CTERM motif
MALTERRAAQGSARTNNTARTAWNLKESHMRHYQIAALALAAAFAASANAATLTLDTNTLPSTQGWTYLAGGDGAAVPESGAFSIVSGELVQNTLGIGQSTGGGNYYTHASNLNPGDAWTLTLVGRINSFESNFGRSFGLSFGGDGSLAVGIAGSAFQYLDGVGAIAQLAFPLGFDPSAYNSYQLSVAGGLQSFSINGSSIYSNQAIVGGIDSPAIIFFGDGTGFANASANIRSLVFTSPGIAGVPEPASWALMIAGFGLVGSAMRRRATKVGYA